MSENNNEEINTETIDQKFERALYQSKQLQREAAKLKAFKNLSKSHQAKILFREYREEHGEIIPKGNLKLVDENFVPMKKLRKPRSKKIKL